MISDLSKVIHPGGGIFGMNSLAALSLRMPGPQAGKAVTSRHISVLPPVLACLTLKSENLLLKPR